MFSNFKLTIEETLEAKIYMPLQTALFSLEER